MAARHAVSAIVTTRNGRFTSPRLRGEVGFGYRANPGEGESPHALSSELAEAAPHPDPLPARAGRGRSAVSLSRVSRTYSAATICCVLPSPTTPPTEAPLPPLLTPPLPPS